MVDAPVMEHLAYRLEQRSATSNSLRAIVQGFPISKPMLASTITPDIFNAPLLPKAFPIAEQVA